MISFILEKISVFLILTSLVLFKVILNDSAANGPSTRSKITEKIVAISTEISKNALSLTSFHCFYRLKLKTKFKKITVRDVVKKLVNRPIAKLYSITLFNPKSKKTIDRIKNALKNKIK